MEITQLDVLKAGLFFVFVFASGIWLRISGKPYSTVKLTLHKFIALGTFIYLILAVYRMHQAASLSAGQLGASITSGVLFVATIITGGLVSVEKEMPASVLILHKISPYLTLLVSALALFLLIR